MKMKHIMKPLPGLYRYDVLVKDIAKHYQMDKSQRRTFLDEVQSVIANGKMVSRSEVTARPLSVASGIDGASPLVTVSDFNQWLQSEGRPYVAMAPVPVAPAPTHAVETTRRLAAVDDEWKQQAREAARAFIKREADQDRYPPQLAVADHVAADFRTRGIVGAAGKPLTGATLKRHALRGISSATKQAQSTVRKRGKWGNKLPGQPLPEET